MLTEQEIMNNALKEAAFFEDMIAQKYADMVQNITKPQLQKLLKGMEMASRNNYSMLNQKMSEMAIV